MPTKCSYTTVNLNAGDNYILPAGAELVYVSQINNVTIPPDCNLTVPTEEAKRFRIQWEMDTSPVTTLELHPWERAFINAVTINDVVYDFADIDAWYGQNNVADTLNSIGAPFWDYSVGAENTPPTNNQNWTIKQVRFFYVDFTALPSIAEKTIFSIFVTNLGGVTGTRMQIIPYEI